ncbi:cyanophycinase-like exopeptidase [Mucilaginibacter sp. HD30]
MRSDLNERLNKADAVYFSGGDQLKLTSVYGGTDLLLTLASLNVLKKVLGWDM